MCLCSDERHPRPGTKRPREDDDEEEDLNDTNFDEVHISYIITSVEDYFISNSGVLHTNL